MALTNDCDGIAGSVWQACFIRDAVILPALNLNHNLDSVCFTVSSLTALAISLVY